MRYLNIILLGVVLLTTPLCSLAQKVERPRVIVTTDGEIDDRSSMVRFLLYTCDFDVAGIVQVNGVQKDGHSKEHWIEEQITMQRACPTCANTTPTTPMPRSC